MTSPQAVASSGSSCGGGNCLRLFYNNNRAGSSTYFWGSNVADLAPYTFLTSGSEDASFKLNYGSSNCYTFN